MDGGQLEAARAILRDALPDGWRVNEPLYDPDRRVWSVWAVARPPIRVLPIRGGGASEAEALVNLAATLRTRYPPVRRGGLARWLHGDSSRDHG
ncbi:MAG TPA: hypothetical protein VID25_04060 [Candidatus Limnocylindrales bacterium]|jgi:hypothetical protein